MNILPEHSEQNKQKFTYWKRRGSVPKRQHVYKIKHQVTSIK